MPDLGGLAVAARYPSLQCAVDRILPSAARSIIGAFEARAREEFGC
ncbi:MAG: hypothetical protein HWD60_11310 [Defluviicoccus sp.]|nr:MAG: hypothetical protein HWD60_11310 [Defluviicoccus sp.]